MSGLGSSAPQKTESLPDLRFLKTSDLASLEDPHNQDRLARLKHAYAWHQKLARDMKRRAELSQDIAEGCERVVNMVEAIAAIKVGSPAVLSPPNAHHAKVKDPVVETFHSGSPTSPSSYGKRSVWQNSEKVHHLEDTSLVGSDAPEHHTERTNSFDTKLDSADKRKPVKDNHPEITAHMPYTPNPIDPTTENGLRLSAAELLILEQQADEAIKCLRILRAQWQAGGRNFEDWAGPSHRQSKHSSGIRQ